MKTKATIKVMMLMIALSSCIKMNAQGKYLSVTIGRDVTGSGLGGNVCPSLSFTSGKNSFSLGANFQRRNMNFSGYQFNYRYAVATSRNEKFQLYVAGNLTYHFSAYLSRVNAEVEQSCHRESRIVYDEMRLKVIECYAGFGLRYYPVKRLAVGMSTGVGMFNTINADYDREMYRDKAAPSLQLRAILSYSFLKN
jgi:hypothetical protein